MQHSLTQSLILGAAVLLLLTCAYFTTNVKLQKSASSREVFEIFQEWKQKYNKQYSDSEEMFRLMNFLKSFTFIQNFKSDSVVLELNKFADLSSEEFKQFHLGRQTDDEYKQATQETKIWPSDFKHKALKENLGVNDLYTWKGTVYDPPILDQGQCGSCWAFATAEVLSAFLAINNKNQGMIVLSPQQIADCTYNETYNGCDGGRFRNSANFTANYGVTTNEAYPYFSGKTGETGKCRTVLPIYYPNKGYTDILVGYTNFKNAMSHGPTKVSIQADQDVFRLYKSGILSAECGVNLDHDVMAVGWSETSQIGQIQNSWGSDWGDQGYIFLNGTANNGAGACGFLLDMRKPTI